MDKFYVDDMSLRVKGDEDAVHDHSHLREHDFVLYTMDISYFSGKLEMYLKYKNISFERIEPHSEEHESILSKNTGSEQLPQLYDCRDGTDEGKRWMRDTTPIIEHLEQDQLISQNSLSILPSCEVQRFFQFLFEDYCDEFLWRPAMFWRWEPLFDREIMGLRFFYEFTRTQQSRYRFIPAFIRPYLASKRQWLLSSYGEDCNTKEKKDVIINQYYELLDVLEKILKTQPYLFGNCPTLIDFGFMGPMYKHFSSDPTPRKVMQQRAPAVYEWIGRLWNCKSDKINISSKFPKDNKLPDNWNELLGLLPDYFDYYFLNAKAFSQGEKTFDWKFKGEACTVPVVPYRVWCRKELQKKFYTCSDEAQQKISSILQKHNCDINVLLSLHEDIIIEPECGTHPPFAVHPPPEQREVLSYKWDSSHIFTKYYTNLFKTGIITSGLIGVTLTGSYFLRQYLKKK